MTEGKEEPTKEDEMEMKEMARKMIEAVTNRETQKHFIRAGMEVVMGIDSMIRHMPMTDDMKAVMDRSAEYFKFLSKEICAVNPNCTCRGERKTELEKIDLS